MTLEQYYMKQMKELIITQNWWSFWYHMFDWQFAVMYSGCFLSSFLLFCLISYGLYCLCDILDAWKHIVLCCCNIVAYIKPDLQKMRQTEGKTERLLRFTMMQLNNPQWHSKFISQRLWKQTEAELEKKREEFLFFTVASKKWRNHHLEHVLPAFPLHSK